MESPFPVVFDAQFVILTPIVYHLQVTISLRVTTTVVTINWRRTENGVGERDLKRLV